MCIRDRDTWDGIHNNTGDTAGNTAAMADSMDVLDEDLKYMRDAAEQEVINRFTPVSYTHLGIKALSG